jgi:hypothetical protein
MNWILFDVKNVYIYFIGLLKYFVCLFEKKNKRNINIFKIVEMLFVFMNIMFIYAI